jgi:hypothetical protein
MEFQLFFSGAAISSFDNLLFFIEFLWDLLFSMSCRLQIWRLRLLAPEDEGASRAET